MIYVIYIYILHHKKNRSFTFSSDTAARRYVVYAPDLTSKKKSISSDLQSHLDLI